jgi:hypothetical protein
MQKPLDCHSGRNNMRFACLPAVVGVLVWTAACADRTGLSPQENTQATLTVDEPAASDSVTAEHGSTAPILQSVTVRKNVKDRFGYIVDVVPDFHFVAPNGNAIFLRRELVDTRGAIAQTNITSATINIPAGAQKRGAVVSGGWRCGVGQYYVTLRAFLMDSDGNRSNSVQYTIHCNGG